MRFPKLFSLFVCLVLAVATFAVPAVADEPTAKAVDTSQISFERIDSESIKVIGEPDDLIAFVHRYQRSLWRDWETSDAPGAELNRSRMKECEQSIKNDGFAIVDMGNLRTLHAFITAIPEASKVPTPVEPAREADTKPKQPTEAQIIAGLPLRPNEELVGYTKPDGTWVQVKHSYRLLGSGQLTRRPVPVEVRLLELEEAVARLRLAR